MKKIFKNPIFMFVFGLVVMASIGMVYAINANQITYNDTTVSEELDFLYLHTDPALKPVLLWTNENPNVSFAAQTINLDLSEYKYIIVVINATTSNTSNSYGIVPINNADSVGIGRSNGSTVVRHFQATSNSVIIGTARSGTTNWNTEAIPYKIYGIKGDLEIVE